jgi:hypothetical protein
LHDRIERAWVESREAIAITQRTCETDVALKSVKELRAPGETLTPAFLRADPLWDPLQTIHALGIGGRWLPISFSRISLYPTAESARPGLPDQAG